MLRAVQMASVCQVSHHDHTHNVVVNVGDVGHLQPMCIQWYVPIIQVMNVSMLHVHYNFYISFIHVSISLQYDCALGVC
jgi:hypothetical protein